MSRIKILIIHASAGAGHKKAAEALYHELKNISPHEVFLADVLDYTSWLYKRTYRNTYTLLVTKLSWAWAIFFALTDLSWFRFIVKLLRRFLNSLNARPLENFLKEKRFDIILSTHFFPNEVASYLKRKEAIASKIISVVTDFDVHSMWLADGIDCYTVACDYTKEKLKRLGVDENKITVCGIPTDKKFSLKSDKDALKEKLQVKKDIFTILIATGSFGIGPIQKIAEKLSDYQVLVVCGHNKKLFYKLNQTERELLKVYGLVDNMHELMAVSDIMITKPGGLSIAEALVEELPLIFFSAIPGQETNNIRVLKSYGIGTSNDDIPGIIEEVRNLSGSKEYFLKAQENTKKLARPAAASDIVKLISS